MPELSLVVPCYQEGPHLDAHVTQVIQTLDLLRLDYEIIMVDDCSTDNTRTVIDAIIAGKPDKPLRRIFHEANQGRGGAFMTGFAASRGRYVGYFDIDLEVPPVYTLEALRLLKCAGADLVIGHRYYKVRIAPDLFLRHVLSRGYRLLVAWALRIPRALDTESGYKFFRREALESIKDRIHYKGWFWDTEVVTRCYRKGMKVMSFPCFFIRDGQKESTVRPIHDSLQYFKHLFEFRRILREEK